MTADPSPKAPSAPDPCYRCGQPGTFYARVGSLGQRRSCERHAKGWPGMRPDERLLRDIFEAPGAALTTPTDEETTRG